MPRLPRFACHQNHGSLAEARRDMEFTIPSTPGSKGGGILWKRGRVSVPRCSMPDLDRGNNQNHEHTPAAVHDPQDFLNSTLSTAMHQSFLSSLNPCSPMICKGNIECEDRASHSSPFRIAICHSQSGGHVGERISVAKCFASAGLH
jgi:hypothetical protein